MAWELIKNNGVKFWEILERIIRKTKRITLYFTLLPSALVARYIDICVVECLLRSLLFVYAKMCAHIRISPILNFSHQVTYVYELTNT